MIEVNNLTRSSIKKKFIINAAKRVLKGEKKSGLDLSIALVGQRKMSILNKKYRGKDRATDVLSFGGNSKFKDFKESGEIVICLAEVKKNAKRWGYSFEAELGRVLIHGVLHVLGYDHEKTAKGAGIMIKKEEFYTKNGR